MKKPELLRVKITESLKSDIQSGKWQRGSVLPTEAKLCEQYKVSRVTIRAALQSLETLGYIKAKQGSGTVVVSTTPLPQDLFSLVSFPITENTKLISILEFRMAFEKGIAGIAATRITQKEIAALEKTYEQMLANINDIKRFSINDLTFHTQICEATKNPLIIQSYASLQRYLEPAMSNIVSMLGSALGIRYHKMLINSMKNHNQAEAEKLMESHIQETIDQITEFLTFQKEK